MFVWVMQRVLFGFSRAFGNKLRMQHSWSCGRIAYKTRFIQQTFKPTAVFKCMQQLAGRTAAVHGSVQRLSVSWVHWFAVGFTCTSVSRLNNKSAQASNCLGTGKYATGEAFWAVVNFLVQHLPIFCMLENVPLGKVNLQDLKEALRNAGYICFSILANALKHGQRSSRPRLWIGCMLMPGATDADFARVQLEAASLELALRQEPLPLSMFLLSEHESDFANFMDELKRTTKRKLRQRDEEHLKWPKLHECLCIRHLPSDNKIDRMSEQFWHHQQRARNHCGGHAQAFTRLCICGAANHS